MVRILILLILSVGLGSYRIECSKTRESYISKGHVIDKDSLILWSPSIKLTWKDFQGIPDPTSEYTALIYVTLDVNPIELTNDKIAYEMTCWFEKKLSWSKNKKSVNLLKHEQLHFDISELAMRNMRKKSLLSKPSDSKKAKEMVKTFFKEAILERQSVNDSYDLETEYGTIASKQKEWEEKITKELKSLEAYSSSKVTIRFGR